MDKQKFRDELLANLQDNILPYWIENMQDPAGGFYGRRASGDVLEPDAPKGAILNARILWSFSAAYRTLKRPEYLDMATRAFRYIADHFIDREYGGVYWSLNADGTPLDTKKQFYAIGFAIYGLSEYYLACGDVEALELAKSLFRDIVEHSRDGEHGGYLEAATRDWKPIQDMRLSDKDANSAKTMNTHLHIIEPFTNLLRAWRDPELLALTRELLDIFLGKILDASTGHLGLFFSNEWQREDAIYSYGHDIEASWLLLETAQVIGDPALTERTLAATKRIADASFEGLTDEGSMIYEREADGSSDTDRHWWVQAEAVIGQLYLWKFHGEEDMLGKAYRTWEYIRKNIVDSEGGEWHWRRSAGGELYPTDDKAGFWKCPYHNTRMVLESARLLK